MKKKSIIILIITALVLSIIGLGLLRLKTYNETKLMSCTHIDENSDLICDECNLQVPFFEFTENKEIKSIVISGEENNILTVNGNMPKDTIAKINKIEKAEAINLAKQYVKDIVEENVHYAYDISLNANENKFQPGTYNQSVKVKISELDLDTSKTYVMLHIKDDGSSEIIPLTKITENEIEFKATTFSTYIVITVGTNNITFDGENFKVYDTEGNEITNGATVPDGTNFNFVIMPNDGYGTTAITCTNAASESVIITSGTVRGMGGLIASVTEDLTVYVTTAKAPVITTQPVSPKVTQGSTATFTVVAAGQNLTYQWQYRETEDALWKNVSSDLGNNYTSASFKLTNTVYKVSGYEFRCLVGDSNFTNHERIASDIAKVSVAVGEVKVGEVPIILEQPTMDKAKVEEGGRADFTVKALGSNLTFTWQYRENRDTYWKTITSAVGSATTTTIDSSATNPIKSSTFKIASAVYSMNGYEYRCLVGNSFYKDHDAVKSDIVTIVLAEGDISKQVKILNVDITKHPESQKVALGESATFSITTEGANTYKWKYKAPGDEFWTDCDNTMSSGYNTKTLVVNTSEMAFNDDTLDVENNISNYQFKCVVSNSSVPQHTKESDVAMLSVAQEVVSTDVQVARIEAEVAVSGRNVVGSTLRGSVLRMSPSDCSVSYQWSANEINEEETATPIPGATEETYTVTEEYVDQYLFFGINASKPGYATRSFRAMTTAAQNGSDVVLEFRELASTNIKIELSKTRYYYNGIAKTPTPTVTIDGVELVEGTDYTVSYEDNTEVGTASVKITGMGQYTGTVTQNFIISALTTANGEIIVDTVGPAISNIVGSATLESVTITADILDLETAPGVRGTGVNTSATKYAITLTATAPAKNSEVWQTSNVFAAPDGKYAYLWVRAEDNVENVSINANPVRVKLIVPASELDVSLDESVTYVYNGKEHKPAVTVKEDGVPLTEGTDYDVTYKNNINAGTATVTVTFKGDYIGTVEKNFTIIKATPTVSVNPTNGIVNYNGTNTFNVTSSVAGKITVASGSATYVGVVSGNGASVAANTATTVTYKGVQATTSEVPIVVTLTPTDTVNYTEASASYTVKGVNKIAPTLSATPNDITLIVGETREITITYNGDGIIGTAVDNANIAAVTLNGNKVAVTGKAKGNVTITVTATEGDNYLAKTITIPITVNAKDLSSNDITAVLNKTSFEYDGTAKKPTATVKDGEKVLVANTDYEMTYSNNTNVGTATAVITGKGNYTGTIRREFSIVDTVAPTKPAITAKVDNYSGTTYVEGTFVNKNIVIEITSTDLTGVTLYEWSTNAESGFTSEGLTIVDGNARMSFVNEMNKAIYFRAKDRFDNYSEVSSIKLGIDKTAPSVSISIRAIYEKDGFKYTNSNNVVIDVTATDNMSDTTKMKIAFINEDEFSMDNLNSDISWMNYEAVKSWDTSDGDGLKRVYVIIKDEAGNQSSYLAN